MPCTGPSSTCCRRFSPSTRTSRCCVLCTPWGASRAHAWRQPARSPPARSAAHFGSGDATVALEGKARTVMPSTWLSSRPPEQAPHAIALRRHGRWLVAVPAVAIAALMAPMVLTGRTFGIDWSGHLWLVEMQARNIEALGHPSLFIQSGLGAFYAWFAD